MDMVSHLAVCIDGAMWWLLLSEGVFLLTGLCSKDLEESLIVFRAFEYLLPVHTTEDGVIDSCVGLLSCGSGHGVISL